LHRLRDAIGEARRATLRLLDSKSDLVQWCLPCCMLAEARATQGGVAQSMGGLAVREASDAVVVSMHAAVTEATLMVLVLVVAEL